MFNSWMKIIIALLVTCAVAASIGYMVLKGTKTSNLDLSEWTLDYGDYDASSIEVKATPATDGETSYYVAPKTMRTDWTKSQYIMFDLKSWGGDYYPSNASKGYNDIILKNGSKTATYFIGDNHEGGVKSYRISLDDGKWKFSGGAKSMADILPSVTEFKIRAEYGTKEDFSTISAISVAP